MRSAAVLLLAAGSCAGAPPQAPLPPQAPPVPAGWVEPGTAPRPPATAPLLAYTLAPPVYAPMTYQPYPTFAPFAGAGQTCVNGVCYPAMPYQEPAGGFFRWR